MLYVFANIDTAQKFKKSIVTFHSSFVRHIGKEEARIDRKADSHVIIGKPMKQNKF